MSNAKQRQLEAQAVKDYSELLGKVVEVHSLCGYVGNDSVDFSCAGTKVRICKTAKENLLRWMDAEWLDPVYEVEIVEVGTLRPLDRGVPEGELPRSCWIYGTSRSTRNAEAQTSDIVSVVKEQAK